MDPYRIRPLNFDEEGEVYTAASFSMLTLLETLPEARCEPKCVPNFSVEEMAAMYRRGRDNADHHYLLAVDEADQPVGHAIALMRADEDGVRYGYSYTRYVLPDHRRRGVARGLLSVAMVWWAEQDAQYVLAHTHPTNHSLQALFASAGFRVIERRQEGRWPSVLLRCERAALLAPAP